MCCGIFLDLRAWFGLLVLGYHDGPDLNGIRRWVGGRVCGGGGGGIELREKGDRRPSFPKTVLPPSLTLKTYSLSPHRVVVSVVGPALLL
jgi:hypothetical protein